MEQPNFNLSEVKEALAMIKGQGARRYNEAIAAAMIGENWEDQVIPRRIIPPNGYPSPRNWWAESTVKAMSVYYDTEQKFITEERQRDVQMFATTHTKLVELQGPTYFVSDALIDALERTDVEQTIPMEELNFPHDAMLFVLPTARRFAEVQGILDHPSYITMFTIARAEHAKFGHSYIVTMIDSDGMSCYSHYPCSGTYGDQLKQYGENFILSNPIEFYRNELGKEVTEEKLAEDKRQIGETVRLAWKLLCAMNAPNEIVRVGGGILRDAREKRGRKGARRTMWSPIMLDLAEKVQGGDGESTGAGVRLHWRRGHFRRQVCGEGRAQRKMIWIKPHKVGSL